MSTASFIRALGPTLGGGLYSASLSWSFLGPWRLHTVYLVQALFAIAGWAASYQLPAWINDAPVYHAPPVSVRRGVAVAQRGGEGRETRPVGS